MWKSYYMYQTTLALVCSTNTAPAVLVTKLVKYQYRVKSILGGAHCLSELLHVPPRHPSGPAPEVPILHAIPIGSWQHFHKQARFVHIFRAKQHVCTHIKFRHITQCLRLHPNLHFMEIFWVQSSNQGVGRQWNG